MAQKVEEFDPEEFLTRKLEEIPGVDILILSLGAFLGTKGWTPITALINIGKGVSERGPEFQAVVFGATVLGGPLGFLITSLLWPNPATRPPPDQLPELIGKAALGAIEAYALTRPGTIGGILQGIGAIVPL